MQQKKILPTHPSHLSPIFINISLHSFPQNSGHSFLSHDTQKRRDGEKIVCIKISLTCAECRYDDILSDKAAMMIFFIMIEFR